MSADSIENIISSGIPPLEIEYYSVNSLEDDERKQLGFRTVVRVNSPELGVLYPDQYRVVTNRTTQCIKLSVWAFNKLLNHADIFLSKYPDDFSLIIYFPARMVLKPDLEKLLSSVPDDKKYILSHLIFEFSSDILFISSPELDQKLRELKEKFGIKLLISEFGNEFCPVLKIGNLPFDYIILDREISNPQSISSINVQSVIQFVKCHSKTCIIENTGKRGLLEKAVECGCSWFCSNRKTIPAGVK